MENYVCDMVIRRFSFWTAPLSICLLTACGDVSHGPTMTNAYGEYVRMIVDFSDGVHRQRDWQPCTTFWFGEINNPDLKPVRLRIERNGRTIRDFSEQELDAMDAQDRAENDNDGTGWNVGFWGARLISSKEQNPCRT